MDDLILGHRAKKLNNSYKTLKLVFTFEAHDIYTIKLILPANIPSR